MVQHLRWSPEQLREHLIRRHGNEATSKHPALKELDRSGPSALERSVLNSKSQGAFARISLKTMTTAVDPMAQTRDQKGKTEQTHNAADGKHPLPLIKSKSKSKSKSIPPEAEKSPKAVLLPKAVAANFEAIGEANASPKQIRINQRSRSIESLKGAICVGSHIPGRHLELRFHGVVLLSVNTLYGLSHFQRVKYRKTWHEVIERAVVAILGDQPQRIAFDRYVIFAHRVSRRLADTDAKSGYLKYPIDGLRYAGVLVEDTEEHFRDFLCTQSIGEPALILRIEAVGEDYVPVAMRNPWAQAIHEEFMPAPKPKAVKRKKKAGCA